MNNPKILHSAILNEEFCMTDKGALFKSGTTYNKWELVKVSRMSKEQKKTVHRIKTVFAGIIL